MLNNNKDIDSKMVLQLSLPVKIELYTHDNEKPKNKEAIDNKLSKLLGIKSSLGKRTDKIPKSLEYRYFNDEDRFLAIFISKQLENSIETDVFST